MTSDKQNKYVATPSDLSDLIDEAFDAVQEENPNFNGTKIPKEETPKIQLKEAPLNNATEENLKIDYDYMRSNLYTITEHSITAINSLVEIAEQSQHPRAFEVLSGLIHTISETQKKLIEIHKEKGEIDSNQIEDLKRKAELESKLVQTKEKEFQIDKGKAELELDLEAQKLNIEVAKLNLDKSKKEVGPNLEAQELENEIKKLQILEKKLELQTKLEAKQIEIEERKAKIEAMLVGIEFKKAQIITEGIKQKTERIKNKQARLPAPGTSKETTEIVNNNLFLGTTAQLDQIIAKMTKKLNG
jgi:hypothetical protein